MKQTLQENLLCQLSATNQTGLYQFSTYTLPVHDNDHFASKINKLKIVKVNGERKLYKDNREVSTLPLKEEMLQFLCFTVSGKSQVTHKQQSHNGAPWSQFSHI